MSKSKVTTPAEREIRVERIFDAPRERVWRAMTDSKQLAQWWGRGHKLDVESNDLKPGGKWRFVEHAPHGKLGFQGTFREVKPPERLTMTFGWDGMPGQESINTIALEDLGGGRTRLVATIVFESKQERDGMLRSGMEQGMEESYAALDRLLA